MSLTDTTEVRNGDLMGLIVAVFVIAFVLGMILGCQPAHHHMMPGAAFTEGQHRYVINVDEQIRYVSLADFQVLRARAKAGDADAVAEIQSITEGLRRGDVKFEVPHGTDHQKTEGDREAAGVMDEADAQHDDEEGGNDHP